MIPLIRVRALLRIHRLRRCLLGVRNLLLALWLIHLLLGESLLLVRLLLTETLLLGWLLLAETLLLERLLLVRLLLSKPLRLVRLLCHRLLHGLETIRHSGAVWP